MAEHVLDVSDTMGLKVLCIERYRAVHGLTASETIEPFDRYGVFGFPEEPPLQWQCIENTVMDVEDFIKVRSCHGPPGANPSTGRS